MSANGQDLADWLAAATAPDAAADPGGLDALDLEWFAVRVPGTAASGLRDATRSGVPSDDLDALDWWFRCSFDHVDPADATVMTFGGLATLADVWLNGAHVLTSANMHRSHDIDVTGCLQTRNDLVVRCRALASAEVPRRPRARWKTRLVADPRLRWHRTSLQGRMPSLRPHAAPVGPWRPVVVRPRADVELLERRLVATVDERDGRVELRARLDPRSDAVLTAALVVGEHRDLLSLVEDDGAHWLVGATTVPDPARWWPHTHGDQPLHDVVLECSTATGTTTIPLGRVGFRQLAFGPDDAPEVVVNGTPVFVRGACWTPIDPVSLAPDPAEVRATLEALRDAGMNMVRVTGTGVYESDAFLDSCDELGILLWHDLMFANLDYPATDEAFAAEVELELEGALTRLQGRPCVAAVAGGSEISQQAAMVGLHLDEHPVGLHEMLRAAVADHLPDCRFWTDSPTIGTHPFTADVGIAHYFGVGAYRRPLTDARVAGVRFAAECLAISNVPDSEAVDQLLEGGGAVHDARWKAGVFRDNGPSWDFEDVRDHYVRELYGVDPQETRFGDPDRYLDLGRAASAEVMRRTFAEWRRPTSSCNGGLVLFLRDLVAGAGIGILDVDGRPKSPYHPLRRTLSPIALLLSDEGVNGLALWALNDTADPVEGTVSVQAFSGVHRVAEGSIDIEVAPRGAWAGNAEGVLGSFLDVTYAYQFGPPSVDAVAVRWQAGDRLLGRAVHHPVTGPLARSEVGLSAVARPAGPGAYELTIHSERLARSVMIDAPGARLSDDVFDIEPGGCVHLVARTDQPLRARVRALNGLAPALVAVEEP